MRPRTPLCLVSHHHRRAPITNRRPLLTNRVSCFLAQLRPPAQVFFIIFTQYRTTTFFRTKKRLLNTNKQIPSTSLSCPNRFLPKKFLAKTSQPFCILMLNIVHFYSLLYYIYLLFYYISIYLAWQVSKIERSNTPPIRINTKQNLIFRFILNKIRNILRSLRPIVLAQSRQNNRILISKS